MCPPVHVLAGHSLGAVINAAHSPMPRLVCMPALPSKRGRTNEPVGESERRDSCVLHVMFRRPDEQRPTGIWIGVATWIGLRRHQRPLPASAPRRRRQRYGRRSRREAESGCRRWSCRLLFLSVSGYGLRGPSRPRGARAQRPPSRRGARPCPFGVRTRIV